MKLLEKVIQRPEAECLQYAGGIQFSHSQSNPRDAEETLNKCLESMKGWV